MRTSCAMMASSVTPPTEDEGAKVDGAIEAGGAAITIQGCLDRSCVVLLLMIAASMAHMNVKWGD